MIARHRITRRRALGLAASGALLVSLAGCESEEEAAAPGLTTVPSPDSDAAGPPIVETPPPVTPSPRATQLQATPIGEQAAAAAPVVSPIGTPTAIASPPLIPTATAPPTETPTPLPISPLSGLPNEARIAGRRPIAVKIPNDPASRPPVGISQAEIVYEHETEGGITRFTALFVLSDLRKVGPIRSARFVDVDLIREYSALFAHVGGSPAVRRALRILNDLDRDEFFYGTGGPYFRTDDRQAPHNTFVDLAKLRADAESIGLKPLTDLTPWVFYADPPPHGAVRSIHVPAPPAGGTYRARYAYDSDSRRYLRWLGDGPTIDGLDGRQVTVENVVVQFTRTEATQYIEDSLGNLSLDIETVGEGKAIVFHDGLRFNGRWSRRDVSARTRFIDESGNPIALRPGHTWVHLLRTTAGILAE